MPDPDVFESAAGVRNKPPQHSEDYINGVYKCGTKADPVSGSKHVLRVHRSKWPPREMHGINPALALEKPHVTGNCEKCGARMIVYDPPSPDVTVVLWGAAGDAHGQVIEEHGTVVEEASVPVGQVVEDEPRSARRK
jgi:hypothetical protein